MAIWLGKQYLGQKEETDIDVTVSAAEDGLSKSLREMARELKSDEKG